MRHGHQKAILVSNGRIISRTFNKVILPSPSFQGLQVSRNAGKLTLRVIKSIPLVHLDETIGVGLRPGFGDDSLRIGGVKIFADCALGPRTAWMLEGFDSAPDCTGISAVLPEELHEAILKADAHGVAATVHATGDRASREVLDIFAEARSGAGAPRPYVRNRIKHVQLLHPDDACRLAELGVIASMQPLHATSDMQIADQHWGRRCAGAYALRMQQDCGAVVALDSDHSRSGYFHDRALGDPEQPRSGCPHRWALRLVDRGSDRLRIRQGR